MFAYRSYLPSLPVRALVLLALSALGVLYWFTGAGRQENDAVRAYLVLGEAWLGRLSGHPVTLPPGDPGYPLLGALLSMMTGDLRLSFSLLSWLSAGVAIWLFDLNIRILMPGARSQSRTLYALIVLSLAPAFVMSGLAVGPGTLALAFMLATFWAVSKAQESIRMRWGFAAGALAGLTLGIQSTLWPILLIRLPGALWQLPGNRRVVLLSATAGALCLSVLLLGWGSGHSAGDWIADSGACDWSPTNWLLSTSGSEKGKYILPDEVPNGIYLLFPLFHPVFCVLLPGLLLLLKRTDWRNPYRSVLLGSLGLYLMYIGGLSYQDLSLLLPAYVLLLLLLFQAWDRFQAYGEFFLPKLAYGIIVAAVLVQIAANLAYVLPHR